MPDWLRTPIAPRHGALRQREPHQLVAPLIRALLDRNGLPAAAVDAVILGNALGAGGNPARLGALAAGLPDRCQALSIDTQCCAGLDAIRLGAGLIQARQAGIVIAGGVEAWSRAPIRQRRPRSPLEAPVSYERPPFTPWPERDPEPAEAAARYAERHGWTRMQQDEYARQAHQRAVIWHAQAGDGRRHHILPMDGLWHDAYPRALSAGLMRRLPIQQTARDRAGNDCSLSLLAISPEADGAAVVLLASPEVCRRYDVQARACWVDGLSLGVDPSNPMLGAQLAADALLTRHQLSASRLASVELHDAFALQGLALEQALGLAPGQLNPHGGGLARGHPIGASGAIALVDLLERLERLDKPGYGEKSDRMTPDTGHTPAEARLGLACIAAAGGLGAAALVSANWPSARACYAHQTRRYSAQKMPLSCSASSSAGTGVMASHISTSLPSTTRHSSK
ncbi:MAG: thiolase family protein [Lautropia sp.]|nr:thiolase family protein [Lautropia sp.]